MRDVVEERVKRVHALAQPAVGHAPFVYGNDPRHDVEGNQPLGPGFLAVDRERDPEPVKRALGLFTLLRHPGRSDSFEPAGEGLYRDPTAPSGVRISP